MGERSGAKASNAEADTLFADGQEAGTTDDDVRTTVYLASVFFIVGISSHFAVRSARIGSILIGATILIFSAIQLLTLPKPH
jgi:hypothetical protein